MKVYSLNPVSVHQEDSKMNTVQPSLPAQGIFLDTPQKLSELDPQDFVQAVNNMNNAQAAYQSQTDAENNKYSHIFKNQKQTPVVENLKNIRDGKDKTRSFSVEKIYEYDIDSTSEELNEYCSNADFVFNLAGVNRPKDNSEFMSGNFGFASTLLDTLKAKNK